MSAVWSSDEPPKPRPEADPRLPRAVAVVTSLGAGFLLTIGATGSWSRIEGSPSFFFPVSTLIGDYGWEGAVVVVLGVVTMAVAALGLIAEVPPAVRAVPAVAGLASIGLVAYHLTTFEERYAAVLSDFDFAPGSIGIAYAAVVVLIGAGFAVIGGLFAVLAGRAGRRGLEPGARGAAATPPS